MDSQKTQAALGKDDIAQHDRRSTPTPSLIRCRPSSGATHQAVGNCFSIVECSYFQASTLICFQFVLLLVERMTFTRKRKNAREKSFPEAKSVKTGLFFMEYLWFPAVGAEPEIDTCIPPQWSIQDPELRWWAIHPRP
jgi:hypothetical protein